jgi:hypothetical protein
MSIPLLYVTSFNRDLYEVTGKRLLKSFTRHKIDAKFLITYENFNIQSTVSNFIYYNLEKDAFLQKWLKENKNIIPKQYGGTAPECKCEIKTNNDKWFGHSPGCAHSEWNRRASKWFRKITSLNYALRLNPEKIIFLDSDVYFIKHLPYKAINSIFSDNGLIYHLGKWRKEQKTSIESGVIGFSSRGGGFDFLRSVIKCYTSGKFKEAPRWDDGYIFKYVLNQYPQDKLKAKDLVTIYRKTSHVVNLSVMRNFFVHDKGHHLKKYKIV